jgi:anaerobic selenocysteine-containing dehydrogenase
LLSERGAGNSRRFPGTGVPLLKSVWEIRATDPPSYAFTGRDQMQALTGLFARQFGTPNYAAHGGFCSVNMAAGMIYTIGGSFWEFGGPDLDRARLLVMISTAETTTRIRSRWPVEVQAQRQAVRRSTVRTGYSAIAGGGCRCPAPTARCCSR